MTGAIHVKEAEANHTINDKLHDTPEEVEGDKEVKVALDALSRVTNATCPLVETVIIQGSPGLRKTELVHRLHGELEAHKACIVRVKYDRLMASSQQVSTVADCFKQLFEHANNSPNKRRIVQRLEEDLREGGLETIGKLVPSVYDLVWGDTPSARRPQRITEARSITLTHRLQVICGDVLRILTSELEHVVFICEDLHWAIPAVLELTKFMLLNNSDCRYVAIFTYVNDKERAESGGLSHLVRSLAESGIRLKQLQLDDGPVNRANYVKSLDKKIELLAGPSKDVFKVAALLGSHFSPKLLETVVGAMDQVVHSDLTAPLDLASCDNSSNVVQTTVRECLSLGLMEFVAHRYQFVDDSAYDSAIFLLEEDSDPMLIIFKVGRILYHMSSKEQVLLLPAVIHLNSILDSLPPNSQRQLAQLNLEAAKYASRTTAYGNAVDHLQQGLELLGDNKWQSDYQLSLELATLLTEMTLAVRDYVCCKIAIDEVVLNAASIGDKLPVYYTLIDSLRAQGRSDEAVQLGLQLLHLMGEKIHYNGFRLSATALKLRSQFNKNLQGFCDRPPMNDPEKLEVCRLLHRLAEIAWTSEQMPLGIELQCRIVQLSLKYGPCQYSALGFAALGIGFHLKDYIEDSYRAGQLALALLDTQPTTSDGMVESLVYYFIDHWHQPFNAGLNSLKDAYQCSLDRRSLSSAMFSAFVQLSLRQLSGEPLKNLNLHYQDMVDKMIRYSETHTLMKILPEYQFQLNMSGENRDPLVLSGGVMTEENFLADCAEMKSQWSLKMFHLQKMKLAYYFGNYEKARESMKHVDTYDSKQFYPRATLTVAVFFGGLVGVEMYKTTLRKKYLQEAKKGLMKLQKWKKAGCTNVNHTALLLEAEIAAASHFSTARALFKQAIDAAAAIGYPHDRALANERAAIYCLSDNDTASACEYMVEATRMYTRWDASVKVAQLKSKYRYLFYDQNSAESSMKSNMHRGSEGSNLRFSKVVTPKSSDFGSSGELNAYARRGKSVVKLR